MAGCSWRKLLVAAFLLFLVIFHAIPRWETWPDDPAAIVFVLQRALPGLLLVLAWLILFDFVRNGRASGWFRQLLGVSEEEPAARPTAAQTERLWNVAGWLILVGALVLLEVRQPYYFTQDDVLVSELPGVLVGCRNVWQGYAPNYNPYLLLGAPLANAGLYSLTYPPLYLAYAVARHVLGNEYATMDVLAIMHILAGFLITRALARRIGMGVLPANLASLSFVLSGSTLIMGRSWHAFVPVVVWMPLLAWGVVRLQSGPVGWKWVIGMGLALAMPFHIGFPQVAVYTGAFFTCAVLLATLTKSVPLRRAAAVAPALLLGAGLAAPILFQQWLLAGDVARDEAGRCVGLWEDLPALLLPYPLVQSQHPACWGSAHVEAMSHLFYFGGLFALLFAVQLAGLAIFWPGRKRWAGQVWAGCGAVAVLLALGDAGGLWWILTQLPVFGQMNRYPFRVLPFLVLFAVLTGGMVLERLLCSRIWRLKWEALIGGPALALLLYHVWMAQTSFYSYGFTPFPELPPAMAALANESRAPSARVVALSQKRSIHPDFGVAMPLQLPAVYGLPALHGYDPVTECKPAWKFAAERFQEDPIGAGRAYAVRWYIVSVDESAPVLSPNRAVWPLEQDILFDRALKKLPRAGLPKVASVGPVSVLELSRVDPLAFAVGHPEQSLPVRLHGEGIDVDTSTLPAGGDVVVNYLRYPEMQLYVAGEPVECREDEWQRMVVTVPPGGGALTVRYSPAWGAGLAIGLAVAVLALALAALVLRRKSVAIDSPTRQQGYWLLDSSASADREPVSASR